MNTDIRLSVDFYSSLKVRKLIKRLGADGVVSLLKLWIWCAKERPTGVLSKCAKDDIDLVADWNGDSPNEFADTLIELGFLDIDAESGEYVIHDWIENNPYAAEAAARSDCGRLNRLKRENPEAAQQYIAEGRKGISKEEYASAKLKGGDVAPYEGTYKEPTSSPCTPKPKPIPKPKELNIAVGNKGGMGGEEPKPASGGGSGEQEQLLTDHTPEEQEVLSLFEGVHDLKQADPGKLVKQYRTLKADFPSVDILSEVKKMALWLENRDKKSNAKANVLLFMRNWVERASKTPSPSMSDLQRYKNGPPQANADGSIGKADEGNEERNRRLAEKYMKQFEGMM